MPIPSSATAGRPSQEEIIQYIKQVAARWGIDANVLLQTVQNESGFDPSARGDFNKAGQPTSGGLAQLHIGGGLGDVYQQQTGGSVFNPEEWRQHLDFMGQQVAQGGKGLAPWHGWKGDPFQGVPQGGPQVAARSPGQARAAQAQQPTPGFQPQQQAAQAQTPQGLFAGLSAKDIRDIYGTQKPPMTLGGLLARKTGLVTDDPNDPYHQNSPTTLLSAVFKKFAKPTGVEGEKAKIAGRAEKINTASPVSSATQLARADKAKATVGSSLFDIITGRKAQQPQQVAAAQPKPTTLGSMLFGSGGGWFT